MLRLLPDENCGDKGLVDAFHEFFARFSEISNKTYLASVHSVVGAVNRSVYVLEEFVSGIPLTEFIEKNQSSDDFKRDAINIIARVCEALHYAHQKDIWHLCIAPDDILVDQNNPGKVKLVGFGAQIFVENNRLDSLPIEVKKYLAPELLGGKSFGSRADVYSLAAAIKEVFPEPVNWDSLISRSLSKTASERPSSARTFAHELKDLVVRQKSSPRKQSASNNAGGLQPLLNIRTTPEGAQVSLNGASVGITTAAGLRTPWKQGLSIEITKSGFATETLNFTDSPDNSEITVKLKSAFRLFSNPWGASVLVDGKHVGVTDRDGLVVPWDKGEIVIEKSRCKTKKLIFAAPPTQLELIVELEQQSPTVSAHSQEQHTQSSYVAQPNTSSDVSLQIRFTEWASSPVDAMLNGWRRLRKSDLLEAAGRIDIWLLIVSVSFLAFIILGLLLKR
jgi:serine/threonine protein kinase